MDAPQNNRLAAWYRSEANDQWWHRARLWALGSTLEGLIYRYGWVLLIVLAFGYYGQYYRSGLNFGGEGGTAGVLALRLMEGQRPITDTFLGYNVMWFYPIVWLFQLVGPNYVALRIYFFVICTLGAILGFLVLRRSTGHGLYSLLVASLLVLMPGMIFRNYMPFLGLLNMFLLLQAYVFTQRSAGRTLLWQCLAGLALGLTYLIRVELGIFFSAITLGLAVLYPLGFRRGFLARLPLAIAGPVLAVVMVFATHLPVYLDAQARGFAPDFLRQYSLWFVFLDSSLREEIIIPCTTVSPSASPATVTQPTASPADLPSEMEQSSPDQEGLRRLSLAEIKALPAFYDKAFGIITYLPILVSTIILVLGGSTLAWALWTGRERAREVSLTILCSLGCALTLFPQFFFFRPDSPHLSEFMAPFLVVLGCALWHALRAGWMSRSRLVRSLAVALALLCVLNGGLYTYHAMPKESAGAIGSARKKKYEFIGDNGVRVFLGSREQKNSQAIYDAVRKYSKVDDYVVCYPYAPTINFMTNRRSYERNLYADNATEKALFHDETVAEIEKYRPALILIDNRDINRSDSSRFSIWAAATYAYIRAHYRAEGVYGRQELYVRPDLIPESSPN